MKRKSFPSFLNTVSSLLITAAALIMTSCGGSKPAPPAPVEPSYRYPPRAEMTANFIESYGKELAVACPKGWQETVDKKNAPAIALWLVKEDYAASLSFNPMKMDPALYRALQKDGLNAVAKVSLSLKKNNAQDTVTVVQTFEPFQLNKRNYIAYEYTTDGGKTVVRVVVFDTGKQFFECVLLPATVSLTPTEQRLLFETQQSILKTLRVQ
jgi:hypothetical protein